MTDELDHERARRENEKILERLRGSVEPQNSANNDQKPRQPNVLSENMLDILNQLEIEREEQADEDHPKIEAYNTVEGLSIDRKEYNVDDIYDIYMARKKLQEIGNFEKDEDEQKALSDHEKELDRLLFEAEEREKQRDFAEMLAEEEEYANDYENIRRILSNDQKMQILSQTETEPNNEHQHYQHQHSNDDFDDFIASQQHSIERQKTSNFQNRNYNTNKYKNYLRNGNENGNELTSLQTNLIQKSTQKHTQHFLYMLMSVVIVLFLLYFLKPFRNRNRNTHKREQQSENTKKEQKEQKEESTETETEKDEV